MKLNFKTFGQGKPVIILHGLFGMLDNWKSFARQLGEHYKVFIIDQRDHGKSPHTHDFNYSLLAEDLFAFINEHGIEPHAIIGHSMGGKSAMQFINDHPGMTNKLVVVDIGPNENPENHLTIFKALKSVPIERVESRSEVEDALKTYVADQGVRLFLMKNLRRSPEGNYTWKMNLDLLIEKYSAILAEISFQYPIDTPTLFVRGELSDYIDSANVDRIHEVFMNHEITDIEGAGHWVHADKPAVLLEKLVAFLDN